VPGEKSSRFGVRAPAGVRRPDRNLTDGARAYRRRRSRSCCIHTRRVWTSTCWARLAHSFINSLQYGNVDFIQQRRTRTHSRLPSAAWGLKLGCRACCWFASVHRLPRPRGYKLGHCPSATASRAMSQLLVRASCKLAGVEWDDGVAGSSARFGPSTECVRPSEPPPPSAQLTVATLEMT
jgi:hypothetical protein